MIKVLYFCLFLSAALGLAIENRNVTLTRVEDTGYYISSDSVTFTQAWAFCEIYGMQFISFNNASENNELLQIIDNLGVTKPVFFWVGGIYVKDILLSKWYWVNGDNFFYTNWYSNTLVTGDNCIRWAYTNSTDNGRWYSSSCATQYKFICKSK